MQRGMVTWRLVIQVGGRERKIGLVPAVCGELPGRYLHVGSELYRVTQVIPDGCSNGVPVTGGGLGWAVTGHHLTGLA